MAKILFLFVALLTGCSLPPRAPVNVCSVPAPVECAPSGHVGTRAASTGREGLLAGVRALTLPVSIDSSSYAGVAIGAELKAVLARSPLSLKAGASPVGEVFPERFMTAQFAEGAPLDAVDLLDGTVIAVRARTSLTAADATPDAIGASSAILAELRARFGAPSDFRVEPTRLTVWFHFSDPENPDGDQLELRIALRFANDHSDLTLELRGGEKGVSLRDLQQEAQRVIEKRERTTTCAECRQLRVGQTVARWFTVVSVDVHTCTMKIKRGNGGMQETRPGHGPGETSELPCTRDNGY